MGVRNHIQVEILECAGVNILTLISDSTYEYVVNKLYKMIEADWAEYG